MAQYDVTYTCGHASRVSLCGKNDERYRKIDWMDKEGLCTDCYKNYMDTRLRIDSLDGETNTLDNMTYKETRGKHIADDEILKM